MQLGFCVVDDTSTSRLIQKQEMLGSIVSGLASPRKTLGEKKFWVKFFLSTQDGIKLPEMHKKVKVGNIFLEVKKKFEKKKKKFQKQKLLKIA